MGSYLPDADVAAAKELRPRKVKWFSYSILSIVMMRVMGIVYRLMGMRFNGHHRRSFHTIFGITIAVVLLAAPAWFILTSLGWWSDVFIFIYVGGLLCGALFHLAEDCCTVNGLKLFCRFYPCT
ncbi:metal-dependent hydrolase [Methanogenium cariaci]|uniref:metal-dependent hydrolase n=1 Tax=Methanogenium cariaci TaxID=2197 RepID=UPI000783C18C|nr:metal-dependent hydrolase [Methanogenium cariaci]